MHSFAPREPALVEAGTRTAAHTVQFYGLDERPLRRNVCRYLREGLAHGEHCLVVATQPHCAMLRSHLSERGTDVAQLERQGRLVMLDAQGALDQFTIGGVPDQGRFSASIGDCVRALVANGAGSPVRAYGEMVGILWNSGNASAAIRLEQLWNALAAEVRLRLYCAYPVDVFAAEFCRQAIDPIVCEHGAVVSSGNDSAIVASLDRAMQTVLESKSDRVRRLVAKACAARRPVLPAGEATILWLRNNLRNSAEQIIGLAQRHYVASQGT